MHPRCRSTISAVVEGGTRTAKVGGKNIRVPADMHYHDFKRVFVDKSLSLKDWQESHSRKLLQKSSSRILQAAAAGDKIIKTAKSEKPTTPLKLNEALDQPTLNAITELVRAAPEYIQNLWNLAYDHIKIADKDFGEKSHYSPELQAIFFNLKSDTTSTIFKPYKDFFHEIGHLIDHWTKNYGGYLSVTYKNGLFGRTLKDEAREYIDRVRKSMNATTNFNVHDKIVKDLARIPIKFRFELSDIWHGASVRRINLGVTHPEYDYWTRDGGANVAREAFAHIFTATIYNPTSADIISKFFPRSWSIFNEMIVDFLKERGK